MDLIPPWGADSPKSKDDDVLALSPMGTLGVLDPDTKSAGMLDGLWSPNVGVLVETGAESVSSDRGLTLLSGNGGRSGIEFGSAGEAKSRAGEAKSPSVFGVLGTVLGVSVATNKAEDGTGLFSLVGLPGRFNALVGMLEGAGVNEGEGKAGAVLDEPNEGAGVLLKASKPLDAPGVLEGPVAGKGESVLPGPDTSGNVSIPISSSYSGFNGVSVPFRAMYPL